MSKTHYLLADDAVIHVTADRYVRMVEADADFYAARCEALEASKEEAVKAAVDAERKRKPAPNNPDNLLA
jgi:hypothetical protein